MQQAIGDNTEPHWQFDARLAPHRSLSPAGFWLLMLVVGGVSFVTGLLFWSIGAWPIMGFFGLDVLLVYVAFRFNYRSGRLAETVQLSDDELVVSRISPRGTVSRWSFQPYWVRVSAPASPDSDAPVTLASHGRELAIGSFLTTTERIAFAEALREALHRQRNPGFAASSE